MLQFGLFYIQAGSCKDGFYFIFKKAPGAFPFLMSVGQTFESGVRYLTASGHSSGVYSPLTDFPVSEGRVARSEPFMDIPYQIYIPF